MPKVKFTSISAVDQGENNYPYLYALDDTGRVWINVSPTEDSKGCWSLLDMPDSE